MPTSKSRNKKYVPRKVKMPSILDNLPVPAVMVKKLANDMDNRILRLRFAGNNGKDLAALVMYFAAAWLLAGEMANGQELRDKLENGVRELGKVVLSSPDAVHGPMYDTILDLTSITTAVVAESTVSRRHRAYPLASSVHNPGRDRQVAPRWRQRLGRQVADLPLFHRGTFRRGQGRLPQA